MFNASKQQVSSCATHLKQLSALKSLIPWKSDRHKVCRQTSIVCGPDQTGLLAQD